MNETESPVKDPKVNLITEEYVRRELVNFEENERAKKDAGPAPNTDLVATEIRHDSYGYQGWMFTLTGIPSRGFALYFPGERAVYFYDFWGNKRNELFYTHIEDYVDGKYP
jgi:hypothetical protein